MRKGYADLPLHYGRVPQWLAQRMTQLARAISEAIVIEYGPNGFLQRISDPDWFQCFGCALGMDWHSSGITTSVLGALKRAINPIAQDLGLYVCGGRGRYSRKTPDELLRLGETHGFDPSPLIQTSRLCAKIDNNLVQDGFQIYLHTFILALPERQWSIIQQGMAPDQKLARRYHWYAPKVVTPLIEPHCGVIGQNRGTILNLTDRRAVPAQHDIVELTQQKPIEVLRACRHLRMPSRHHVRAQDIDLHQLGAVLAIAYERQFRDFSQFLLQKNVGPRTIQALALTAQLIYGHPVHFRDPARFAFAHGGKDGHPHPVLTRTYDETIETLKEAVNKAKVGHSHKLESLRKLTEFAREVGQHHRPRAHFNKLMAKEHREAPRYGGRTVFDRAVPPASSKPPPAPRQLDLFDDFAQ